MTSCGLGSGLVGQIRISSLWLLLVMVYNLIFLSQGIKFFLNFILIDTFLRNDDEYVTNLTC